MKGGLSNTNDGFVSDFFSSFKTNIFKWVDDIGIEIWTAFDFFDDG